MIFAMSDMHGHFEPMRKRIEQLIPYLRDDTNRVIFLGDYIDRGPKSCQCLQAAYELQKEYGSDRVIALRGNHEEWFCSFLYENDDLWLAEDNGFCTSASFLDDGQLEELRGIAGREAQLSYLRDRIRSNHRELLSWMRKLRGFYETETQIFVHAGVEEDIPEDEVEWCTLGTPDYVLTGKYPPSKGKFYKDIIAGHVSTFSVSGDRHFQGIYFDGESHFYIDGSTSRTKRLLCLAYDEKDGQYYEFMEDGSFKRINRK